MDKFLFVFICISGVSLALGASYNYIKNDANGPSNWGGLCYNGTKQSPIDINSTAATYSSYAAFDLDHYDETPSANFTATNNGHTLQVTLPDNNYFVTGGGLTGNFTTAQFHIHWGSSNSKGSEHFLDGKQYAAEIHFVSYNNKYASLSTAMNESDGLAVLGVLIEVGSANSAYDGIVAAASKVVNASSSAGDISPFKLSTLLPANQTRFYRYSGSLTTPACYESVQWTVFADSITISSSQIAELRKLKMNDTMDVSDNFRPIQSLGSRTVKASFKKASATEAPTGTAPIPTEAGSAAFTKITTGLLMFMLFAAFFFN